MTALAIVVGALLVVLNGTFVALLGPGLGFLNYLVCSFLFHTSRLLHE